LTGFSSAPFLPAAVSGTSKLRLQLADMEQKKNAPRKYQNFVRAVEDLRSVVGTSLQKSLKQTPTKR
jgi:hypothetical protein